MTTAFDHSAPAITAGTSRTLLYGPVSPGVTCIIFSGTFANIDNTNQVNHWITLESYDGTANYTARLNEIPIPFGGTSMCPKIVLFAGESLYVTSDTAGVVMCSVEAVLLS
jgi:hypothetical protein